MSVCILMKRNVPFLSMYSRCPLAASSVGNKVAHNKEVLDLLTSIFGKLPELEKQLMSAPKPAVDSSGTKLASKDAASKTSALNAAEKTQTAPKEKTASTPSSSASEKTLPQPKQKTEPKTATPKDTKNPDPPKPTDTKK